MNYKVEKAEKSTVKIYITLDKTEWEAANTAAYNKTKGKYSLQGFRKGHVPKSILEKTYGEGIFFEDAINEAFPKYYFEILDKETEIKGRDQRHLLSHRYDDLRIRLNGMERIHGMRKTCECP